MCGRTACTLAPNQLCRACTYRDKQNNKRQPHWKDQSPTSSGSPKDTSNSSKQPTSSSSYTPSYNFAPDNVGPVLVSGSHFPDEFEGSDRVIHPMKWGFIPSWFKGATKTFKYKMINARLDGLTEKPSYRSSLEHGRRCVVLADGFFEWKSTPTGKGKRAYFIHFPQERGGEMDFSQPDTQLTKEEEEEGEWKGRRLLTMAGIFDIASPVEGEDPMYSYAVITVPSSKKISWLHDRMPAVLDGEEAVTRWLDHENVSLTEAMKGLKPLEDVEYYEVSDLVNNVKHKQADCLKPLQQLNKAKTKSNGQTSLLKFFQPREKGEKRHSSGGEETEKKKVKTLQW